MDNFLAHPTMPYMHNIDLLLTLTSSLAVALVLGYVTHRLGLSPIVGYLLAGIVVGKYTPGFIADMKLAEQMAEVGVILLMFGVGLQFHWEELLAVRRVAIPGAIAQSAVATMLGLLVALVIGWSLSTGLVFGLALSVASTVVLVRVLADNHDLHTPAGHIAVGWLVVEDIFTVAVLVLLPLVFDARGGGPASLLTALGLAGVNIFALVVFTFLVGGRVIPWLLEQVASTGSRELFTLTVLTVALGIAVGSATLFDVSMALGAFLAGMVVGRSEFSLRAAAEALPMRDAFAVLFFVSVGMQLYPLHFAEAPGLVAATLAVILVGKPLAALLLVRFLGYPVRTTLAVSVALAQIGEFSFILAALGKQLRIFPEAATHTLVAAAIVSITLNPLLYRTLPVLESWAKRRPRLWAWLNARVKQPVLPDAALGSPAEASHSPRHRAVVIGYGPVGQTVSRLLRDNDIIPTVIELNLETVRRLRMEGIPAVYGDAAHRDILTNAGVAEAGSLILSASGMQSGSEVIRLARELNPQIRILARSAYVRELTQLRAAGVERVYAGEGEVALALTETILRELGATPEQIDRERERVRAEMYGNPMPASPGAAFEPPAKAADGGEKQAEASGEKQACIPPQ